MSQPNLEDRIALLESEMRETRQLLSELARKQNGPQYVTVKELAEVLQVSDRTVHDWVSDGRIPFHKVGGGTRFLISEIVQWTAGEWDDKRRLRAV
ncbi:MAG: helix-turn-helix domain-containing protein [Blastocatellia bacterium]